MATTEKTVGSSNVSSIGFVCEDTETLRRMVKIFSHLKERKCLGRVTGLNLYSDYGFSNDVSASE